MTLKIFLVGILSVVAVVALFVSLSVDDGTNNDISTQSEPYNYEDICGYPVTHEMRLDILSKSKMGMRHDDPPFLDFHDGVFSHVEKSQYLTDEPILHYWYDLENGKQVYFGIGACDLDDSDVLLTTLGPNYKDWKIPEDADFDITKYEVLAAPGSPLIYQNTLMPVLDVENCKRVADDYTNEGRWELVTRQTMNNSEAPWGNQLYPLMDYCTSIGKYELKTLDGNINWSYTLLE